MDKYELEQKLLILGGKLVQSPPTSFDSNFIALAGKDCGIRVKNFKLLKSFDILNFQWILDCETTGKIVSFKTR